MSRKYDAMAPELHELGILCEPDSREPWFICEAHAADDSLAQTLSAFEHAVDITMEKLDYRGPAEHAAAG